MASVTFAMPGRRDVSAASSTSNNLSFGFESERNTHARLAPWLPAQTSDLPFFSVARHSSGDPSTPMTPGGYGLSPLGSAHRKCNLGANRRSAVDPPDSEVSSRVWDRHGASGLGIWQIESADSTLPWPSHLGGVRAVFSGTRTGSAGDRSSPGSRSDGRTLYE